jgi:hypothetical protein
VGWERCLWQPPTHDVVKRTPHFCADCRPPRMTSAVNDIVAGGLGGMVCKLFEFPLDTLKVQLQTQSEGAGRAVGPLSMLRTSVRKHGALGLYRGLPGPLAASMAENAVLFLSYGAMARLVDSGPKEDLPAHKVVVCSLAAAFCVSAVLTPVELVKCRMQTAHPDAVRPRSTPRAPLHLWPSGRHCIRPLARSSLSPPPLHPSHVTQCTNALAHRGSMHGRF